MRGEHAYTLTGCACNTAWLTWHGNPGTRARTHECMGTPGIVRIARASVSSRCAHARRVVASAEPPAGAAPGPPTALRAALRCRATSCRSSNHCASWSVCGTMGLTRVARPVAGSRATKVTRAVILGSDRCDWPRVRRMSREEEPVYTTCPAVASWWCQSHACTASACAPARALPASSILSIVMREGHAESRLAGL